MASARTGAIVLRLAALLLALTGAGCATHMRFVCPAHGGPEWRELTTAHVVLRTDLDAGPAERMAHEFELMHALLAEALSLRPSDVGDPIQVIAFATKEELDDYTGTPQYSGKAATSRFGRQQILVAGLGTQHDTARTIAHEMAHVLSFRVIPRQPRWLAEGLASYLSSVAIPAADGTRAVGTVTGLGYGGRGVPLRELFAWTSAPSEGGYYQTSWLLVRHLAAERPEAFAALQRRLAGGQRAAEAWNESFPEWSLERPSGPETLSALIWASARDWSAPGRRMSATPDPRVRTRLLSAPEVHTMRLATRWEGQKTPRAEIEEALREDPGHVMALAWKVTEEPARAMELSKRAVAAHPEEPAAWRLLAQHLPISEAGDREAALRKAVELEPQDPDHRMALAAFLVDRKPAEAEALARVAIERSPWSAPAHGIHAFALASLARCEEGSRALDRSYELIGDTRDAEERKARDKAALSRTCAEALRRRASASNRAGDYELALQLLDAAVRVDPENPWAWNEHGRSLLWMRRPQDAEASFRRQLEVAPAHEAAWNNLGLALIRQGRHAEAERALRRQLEITPRDVNAHRNLGNALVQLDRPREAVSELETAAELAPENSYVLIELGRARLAAGESAEGLTALERGVDLHPYDLSARNDAAHSLAVADAHLDRAEAWAESVVRDRLEKLGDVAMNDPSIEEAWTARALLAGLDTLGWVRFRQGRLAEGMRLVSVGLDIQQSAEQWEHAGEILEREGRREEAIAAHARALAIGPVRQARKQLETLLPQQQVAAAVAAARSEVLRGRILRRDRAPDAAPIDIRVLLVLGPNGIVSEVLPVFGEIPPSAGALRGARHGLRWPSPGPSRLVLLGRYRCAQGVCAWFLGDEPVPQGPLPE